MVIEAMWYSCCSYNDGTYRFIVFTYIQYPEKSHIIYLLQSVHINLVLELYNELLFQPFDRIQYF